MLPVGYESLFKKVYKNIKAKKIIPLNNTKLANLALLLIFGHQSLSQEISFRILILIGAQNAI